MVKNMDCRRGMVTIACGDLRYYRLALNLLYSYRGLCTDKTPFALICDKACLEAQEFDEYVLFDKATCSYLDKLQLLRYSPYEETIFVDADSLFIKDPKELWNDFEHMDDFSAYGAVLPLESTKGWFTYAGAGEYQQLLHFCVQMHGGVYFFRKTDRCNELFERAIDVVKNYDKFQFAHFNKPADEPVLALSMAISGCAPCDKQERIVFVPSCEGKIQVTYEADVLVKKRPCDATLIHFSTANTSRFLYRYLEQVVNRQYRIDKMPTKLDYWRLRIRCIPMDFKIPLLRRIKRFIKYKLPPKLVRYIYAMR